MRRRRRKRKRKRKKGGGQGATEAATLHRSKLGLDYFALI